MLDYEKPLFEKGYSLIVGTDEAGRGPLCGPVVCAGVIFPKDYVNEDINDSKKLSDKKEESYLIKLLKMHYIIKLLLLILKRLTALTFMKRVEKG